MASDNGSRLVILSIIFTQFAGPFLFSGVAVTLPPMSMDLSASAIAIGMVESLFIGASAAFLLPVGKLADSTDKNTIFKTGLVLLVITSVAIALLPSVHAIIAMRFIQGSASAIISVTGMAILVHVVPEGRRGQYLGIALGAIYAGFALGPLIAGVITTQLGWRWVYVISAVPLVLCALTAVTLLKREGRPGPVAVNWLSSALLMAAIYALVFGSATVGESHWGYVLLALGAGFGALYLVADLRSGDPLVRIPELVRNRRLARALLAQYFLYTTAVGTIFLFSLYLQIVVGYMPQTAGQVLAVSPVLMAVAAPLSGRLSDRLPAAGVAFVGTLLTFAGTFTATFIGLDSPLGLAIVILLLHGLGFALFSSPNMSIIMGSVPKERSSTASALAAMARALGMLTSISIASILLSVHIGTRVLAEHPRAFLAAMHQSFMVFVVLAAIGSLLTLRGNVKARQERPGGARPDSANP